jgi:hypothetical protein
MSMPSMLLGLNFLVMAIVSTPALQPMSRHLLHRSNGTAIIMYVISSAVANQHMIASRHRGCNQAHVHQVDRIAAVVQRISVK